MKTLHAALSLVALTACGGPTCPEPFYEGKGTDEAWRTMQDGEARAKADDTKALTFFVPTEGMQFPNASPPTLTWSTPLTASLIRLPSPRPSMLSRLSELVYSSAWAHLPPVTGATHLFRITVPNRKCPVELLTTRLEWIPSAEAWAQLKEGKGQPLKVDVFSAYLQENRISEGPYHFSKPFTFSVAP